MMFCWTFLLANVIALSTMSFDQTGPKKKTAHGEGEYAGQRHEFRKHRAKGINQRTGENQHGRSFGVFAGPIQDKAKQEDAYEYGYRGNKAKNTHCRIVLENAVAQQKGRF